MKLPFLKGKRLVLRPLEPADAKGPYLEWFNDAEVCAHNSHHVFPYTRKDALEYIERARKDRSAVILAIETLQNGRHIGNISLQRIDHFARNAEYAIVIGDKKAWGKGYGEEASALLLDHAFGALGLERVYAGTFSRNKGMRALARKLGMKEEGLRRRAYFKNGALVDIVEFGLLKSEYMNGRKRGS